MDPPTSFFGMLQTINLHQYVVFNHDSVIKSNDSEIDMDNCDELVIYFSEKYNFCLVIMSISEDYKDIYHISDSFLDAIKEKDLNTWKYIERGTFNRQNFHGYMKNDVCAIIGPYTDIFSAKPTDSNFITSKYDFTGFNNKGYERFEKSAVSVSVGNNVKCDCSCQNRIKFLEDKIDRLEEILERIESKIEML
jgi:hypothetical protein